MLYVAYGSNLNVQQMSYRCPRATVAFTGYLINWKLLYRGSRTGSYATVKRQKGSRVPVAVWNIDNKNEKALDLYEGYPRFYRKKNVFVQLKNGTRKKAMICHPLPPVNRMFLHLPIHIGVFRSNQDLPNTKDVRCPDCYA